MFTLHAFCYIITPPLPFTTQKILMLHVAHHCSLISIAIILIYHHAKHISMSTNKPSIGPTQSMFINTWTIIKITVNFKSVFLQQIQSWATCSLPNHSQIPHTTSDSQTGLKNSDNSFYHFLYKLRPIFRNFIWKHPRLTPEDYSPFTNLSNSCNHLYKFK